MQPTESNDKLKAEDFRFYKVLGNGSYAHVVSAKFISKKKSSRLKFGQMYALKIVSKLKLMVNRNAESAVMEKKALRSLKHENIIELYDTFQDDASLYFVLELASSINLLSLVKGTPNFPLDLCRKITAQIVNALEHIHSKNIIHRDIKPENILFSHNGKVKITDFGSCKILKAIDDEEIIPKHSFVGTAAYIAPEIINGEESGFECDLWSLGCTLFHTLSGKKSPFAAKTDFLSLTQTLRGHIDFPENIDSDAKNLIANLLKKNPSERLGSLHRGGIKELKKDPFFHSINFDHIVYENLSFLSVREDEGDVFDDFNSEENSVTRDSVFSPELNTILTRSYELKLAKNEAIAFSGLIDKRKSLLNHRRELILTTHQRLLYFDPKNGQMKGEVPIKDAFNVEETSGNFFVVQVPSRDYRFKSVTESAKNWVKILNASIFKIRIKEKRKCN